MSERRIALGAAGEAHAAAHLVRTGYRIVARNARADGVEIDLVAQRGDLVVFVEVKTRMHERMGGGAEAVDLRKQARLSRGAAAWLREHHPRARRARLDVITCTWEPGAGWRVDHYEDAFSAGGL
jgi:putative endonuclease